MQTFCSFMFVLWTLGNGIELRSIITHTFHVTLHPLQLFTGVPCSRTMASSRTTFKLSWRLCERKVGKKLLSCWVIAIIFFHQKQGGTKDMILIKWVPIHINTLTAGMVSSSSSMNCRVLTHYSPLIWSVAHQLT